MDPIHMQECGTPNAKLGEYLEAAPPPQPPPPQPQDIHLASCWLSHIHNIPSPLSAKASRVVVYFCIF